MRLFFQGQDSEIEIKGKKKRNTSWFSFLSCSRFSLREFFLHTSTIVYIAVSDESKLGHVWRIRTPDWHSLAAHCSRIC